MPGRPGFRGGKLLSRLKFAARRAVVATSRTPLRHFYAWVYRVHVWYAVRVARGFSQTQSVYVTRSVAKGEITYGVSDIDLVIVGDWPEADQIRLMRKLGMLTALSPLYDSGLWQQAHTRESFYNLWETDYFFQSRFDEGRRQWKLAYGTDLVATLAPVPRERLGGGLYMEARSWWLHFIASAFGSGPTATDPIFRNSVGYKALTEILELARAVHARSMPEESRAKSLRKSIELAEAQDRDFLERLEESARLNHLRFRGDLPSEALRLLLPALDAIHAELPSYPAFEACAPFEIDAHPDELLRTEQAIEHGRRLVSHLKQHWPGYRSASLAPTVASFAPDDLLLLIEVDPDRVPTYQQVRQLCAVHEAARAELRQRVALFLLLPSGACQLEFVNFTEMWRVLIFPPSTPDLFTLAARREFLLDGVPPRTRGSAVWSRFARDLAVEELDIRRSVLSKVKPDVFPSSKEIVTNVWRHLQLEVVVRSGAQGLANIPLSPAAVHRGLKRAGFENDSLLKALEDAYADELAGRESGVRALAPEIIAYLNQFRERGS